MYLWKTDQPIFGRRPSDDREPESRTKTVAKMERDNEDSEESWPLVEEDVVNPSTGCVDHEVLFEKFLMNIIGDIGLDFEDERALLAHCQWVFPVYSLNLLYDETESLTIESIVGPKYDSFHRVNRELDYDNRSEAMIMYTSLNDPDYCTVFEDVRLRNIEGIGTAVEDLILCEDFPMYPSEVAVGGRVQTGMEVTARAHLIHLDQLGDTKYLKRIFTRDDLSYLASTHKILEMEACLRLYLIMGINQCLEVEDGTGTFLGRRFRKLHQGLVILPKHPFQNEHSGCNIIAYGKVNSRFPDYDMFGSGWYSDGWKMSSRGSDMVLRRFGKISGLMTGTKVKVDSRISRDVDSAINTTVDQKFSPIVEENTDSDLHWSRVRAVTAKYVWEVLDGSRLSFLGSHFHWLDVVVYENGVVHGYLHKGGEKGNCAAISGKVSKDVEIDGHVKDDISVYSVDDSV